MAIGYKTRQELKAVTRNSSSNGKFQAQLEALDTLDAEGFAKWWAERSSFNELTILHMISTLEVGLMAALQHGCKVNLGLASFYPRLSGALPKRDSDPESEGLFVRGAVKAKRTLMNGLKKHLLAVNSLSGVKARIYHVVDLDAEKRDTIVARHLNCVRGSKIPIVAGRDDEGVWLEKKKKRGMEKVAAATVVYSDECEAKFVFDVTPRRGKYFLIVGTRCGRPEGYKVIRARYEVKVAD